MIKGTVRCLLGDPQGVESVPLGQFAVMVRGLVRHFGGPLASPSVLPWVRGGVRGPGPRQEKRPGGCDPGCTEAGGAPRPRVDIRVPAPQPPTGHGTPRAAQPHALTIHRGPPPGQHLRPEGGLASGYCLASGPLEILAQGSWRRPRPREKDRDGPCPAWGVGEPQAEGVRGPLKLVPGRPGPQQEAPRVLLLRTS